MMKPLSPQKRLLIKDLLGRLDRVAGDLNVLLLVVALGLAVLDFTFFVTQKTIDNLPPITQISDTQPPPSATP